jgi:processive 1,2-diacylglycerol beta-glucosyltransferase
MTKLAILSVSAGAGHVRCAQALQEAAEARGLTVKHVDVMELVPRVFRTLYAEAFLSLVNRNPALWGYLYHSSDRVRPDTLLNRLRSKIEQLNTRALTAWLQDWQPDYVICSHFLPAALLARLIRKQQFVRPTWVVVTDFDVHALWVQQGLTGYCAAAEEIAWRMRDRGLTGGQIVVTGIPIHAAFRQELDRTQCARELGIDPRRTTLLLMSGGHGVGAIDVLARRILAIESDVQLVALAGKNAELLGKLHQVASEHPQRLFPQGFTRTIERVMACSDLAIGKPGGLTTSECLAMGLPLLVVSPIPGQEERNADYVLEHGAAMKAHDAAGIEYRIRRLLADPSRLSGMASAAKRLGRPRAADAVLDQVLAAG